MVVRYGFVTTGNRERRIEVDMGGINEEFGVDYRVASIPTILPWLDAAERSRQQVELVLKAGHLKDRDLVMSNATVINLEGTGPLIPLAQIPSPKLTAEQTGLIERQLYVSLCQRLMGQEGKQKKGEMQSGVAIFHREKGFGLFTERRIPFSFSSFTTEEEVQTYLKNLTRIIILEFGIVTKKLEEQHQAFTPDLQELVGTIARGKLFKSHPEMIRNHSPTEDDLLTTGLFLSQEFPGGIHLGALVASGKLATIAGIRGNQLNDFQLGDFLSCVNEADGRGVLKLMEILQGKTPAEILYPRGNWTRVFTERRLDYPLYLHSSDEKEHLEKSPEEIWNDPNLPPKIKRQLLLQKLGIEINSHLHVPLKIFKKPKDAVEIVLTLQDLWKTPVGLSSALFNEPSLGRTPSTRFELLTTDQQIAETVQNYQAALSKLKKIPQDRERDQVILYPFVWGDKEHIVGGVTRFDTPPQLVGEQDRTVWIIEMQKGTWPRGIDRAKGDFISLRHEPVLEALPGLFAPTGKGLEIDMKPHDLTQKDTLMAIAFSLGKGFSDGLTLRHTVRRIMEITSRKVIAVEWYYHEPTGRILGVDF